MAIWGQLGFECQLGVIWGLDVRWVSVEYRFMSVEYRFMSVGFVARVNAEHRAAWQAEKKQAQEAQRKRREQGLEDRRAQTTALMALAMGVVSRMQESEREPEFFRENDEA